MWHLDRLTVSLELESLCAPIAKNHMIGRNVYYQCFMNRKAPLQHKPRRYEPNNVNINTILISDQPAV